MSFRHAHQSPATVHDGKFGQIVLRYHVISAPCHDCPVMQTQEASRLPFSRVPSTFRTGVVPALISPV